MGLIILRNKNKMNNDKHIVLKENAKVHFQNKTSLKCYKATQRTWAS